MALSDALSAWAAIEVGSSSADCGDQGSESTFPVPERTTGRPRSGSACLRNRGTGAADAPADASGSPSGVAAPQQQPVGHDRDQHVGGVHQRPPSWVLAAAGDVDQELP